ncbi:MAG: hypothetical protein RLZZ458_1024 [Planctomycetota bacterium]|jgi:hypothetical protein
MRAAAVCSLVLALCTPSVAASEDSQFTVHVFPILQRYCIECHGAGLQESGLRLDDAAALAKARVVVPGKPQQSELWRRINLTEPAPERMPPVGAGLSPAELTILQAWIESGAQIPADFQPPKHWAWNIPRRPLIPADNIQHPTHTVPSPIDVLVRQKLTGTGLSPAAPASPASRIRRLSLDLTGLPPSPAMVAAFEQDPSDAHYRRLVEQFLASPQFGERWARHWLDLARYADSHGFQRDDLRDIWAWRDWVIRAFNADMPFDQFTIEQLAGDLLPNPTESQRIATGFHRCTTVNVEAGSLPEETRAEQLIDRVNTTGTVWLGATLECAQCHDHKYDPFTQQDYYQLLAFFNNTQIEADRKNPEQPSSIAFLGPTMALTNSERTQRREQVAKRLAAKRQELEQLRKQPPATSPAPDKQPTVSESASPPVSDIVLQPAEFLSQGATDSWRMLEDGSILLTGGDAPSTDVYTITISQVPSDIRAIRLDALTHPELPGGGPGRGSDDRPNFVLHELVLEIVAADGTSTPLPFKTAWADFSQQKWDAAGAVDGKPKTGWAIAPQFHRDHYLVAVLSQPLSTTAGSVLKLRLEQHFGSARTLGRFRLTAICGTEPTQPGRPALASSQPRLDHELAALERELAELQPETTLIMAEQFPPRESFVFERGDYRRRGKQVEPGVPQFLAGDTANALPLRTRLDLARWLVSPQNPLAARAAVNRWWAEIFGEGLVSTPEDFGVKGDRPTHPELLDWLAVELIDNGWSMKHILRQIVLSATYQQSSAQSEQGRQLDERNRLLWRGPTFRMDAEMIRDNLLAVSGLLSLKQFGPPIRPRQPAGLWAKVGGTQYEYQISDGEDQWRRGIYVVLKRSAMHPSLMTFDGSSRLACTVRRSRTNTPQQALALLNDPISVAAARALAARLQNELPKGTDSERLEKAFRLCTARQPNTDELSVLADLLADQRAAFIDRPQDALAVIGAEAGANIQNQHPSALAEQAAWCSTAAVLLNLHETVTKN